MSIQKLNDLTTEERKVALERCCGSSVWVEEINSAFPFSTEDELLKKAEQVWFTLESKDWLEAFTHHPKIGEVPTGDSGKTNTSEWAANEQSAVIKSSEETKKEFASCNKHYFDNFGYIFIISATGKSPEEILKALKSRVNNHPKDELRIAAAEQNKINQIRLKKLIAE